MQFQIPMYPEQARTQRQSPGANMNLPPLRTQSPSAAALLTIMITTFRSAASAEELPCFDRQLVRNGLNLKGERKANPKSSLFGYPRYYCYLTFACFSST